MQLPTKSLTGAGLCSYLPQSIEGHPQREQQLLQLQGPCPGIQQQEEGNFVSRSVCSSTAADPPSCADIFRKLPPSFLSLTARLCLIMERRG